MPFPPIEIPGEPDALAEVRLRAELKLLRATATMIGRMDEFWEEFPKTAAVTFVEELKRSIFIEQSRPALKDRLLKTEHYFIERGWHLPKWERPSWLVE